MPLELDHAIVPSRDRAEIVADVANYTDIAPIVQISEIVGA